MYIKITQKRCVSEGDVIELPEPEARLLILLRKAVETQAPAEAPEEQPAPPEAKKPEPKRKKAKNDPN